MKMNRPMRKLVIRQAAPRIRRLTDCPVGATSGAMAAIVVTVMSQLHAGIDEIGHQIDDDVDEDEDSAGGDRDALNHREIAADHRNHGQIAEPRIIEDVFDHEHAADQRESWMPRRLTSGTAAL